MGGMDTGWDAHGREGHWLGMHMGGMDTDWDAHGKDGHWLECKWEGWTLAGMHMGGMDTGWNANQPWTSQERISTWFY